MSGHDIEAPLLASPRPNFHVIADSEGEPGGRVPTHRIDVLQIEKEAVIQTAKQRFILGLLQMTPGDERDELQTLCKRVDASVRAWYQEPFDDLLHIFRLFDPMDHGARLQSSNLTHGQVEELEHEFLSILMRIMAKSNYKLMSDEEMEAATSGTYLLDLPIKIDPGKYLLFRRGVGMEQTAEYYAFQKIDLILSALWNWVLICLCIRRYKKWSAEGKVTTIGDAGSSGYLRLERIHLENMQITLKNLFSMTKLQEPTFERIIVIYRSAGPPGGPPGGLGDRSIKIKHFRHIPMADMEIVLPEKKTPGLTPSDWIKFLITAVTGLIAFVGSMHFKLSFSVLGAIILALVGYLAKVYGSWQESMKQYEEMIKNSMYDKQLDSNRGTLLHLCDDVLQQEVKETILAYFVLLKYGAADKEELDRRCETMMSDVYGEEVDFDVGDAVEKLERIGIVTPGEDGKLIAMPLKDALEEIGVTTDEMFGQGDEALGLVGRTKSMSLPRLTSLQKPGRTLSGSGRTNSMGSGRMQVPNLGNGFE
eukprot:jgi/Mesen1/5902/ME000003S06933